MKCNWSNSANNAFMGSNTNANIVESNDLQTTLHLHPLQPFRPDLIPGLYHKKDRSVTLFLLFLLLSPVTLHYFCSAHTLPHSPTQRPALTHHSRICFFHSPPCACSLQCCINSFSSLYNCLYLKKHQLCEIILSWYTCLGGIKKDKTVIHLLFHPTASFFCRRVLLKLNPFHNDSWLFFQNFYQWPMRSYANGMSDILSLCEITTCLYTFIFKCVTICYPNTPRSLDVSIVHHTVY